MKVYCKNCGNSYTFPTDSSQTKNYWYCPHCRTINIVEKVFYTA